MKRSYTCIICPNGCDITAEYEGADIRSITGNTCPKGEEYVRSELTRPMRSLTSSVLVTGGDLPLVSVRLSAPVPKNQLFPIMEKLRIITVPAPVHSGQIICRDILGLGCDVFATKNIACKN